MSQLPLFPKSVNVEISLSRFRPSKGERIRKWDSAGRYRLSHLRRVVF
jgi:hypothetical protein